MRDFILIALSFFIWGIGEGTFFYFQPLYLQELGASPILIGTILGLNGLAMTLVQIPGGYLADRIGTRKVMMFSWILGTFCTLIMAFAPSLIVFSIGYILFGLSASNAATNSYNTKIRGKLSVSRALTVVSAAYYIGALIGPTIGGQIGERSGLSLIYRISTIMFAVSTSIIFFTRPDQIEPRDSSQPKHNLLKNRSFILLLSVCFISIFSGYLAEPLTSNYLQNVHKLTLSQIGQLGSIGSLGNAVISLAFGGKSPFVGILIGHVFLSVFSLTMWKGTGMGWFSIGFFMRGGYRIYQSMYMAIARTLTPPADMGLAYGIVSSCNSIAVILAPLLAGLLYEIRPQLVYPVALSLVGITFIINLAASRQFKNKGHGEIKET